MKIVTVIPLEKGVFKTDLTYFTAKDIKNGSIVNVPVRNKKILGLVISCQDVSNEKSGIKGMPFNLKKIIEIKKHSIFRDDCCLSGAVGPKKAENLALADLQRYRIDCD